MIQCYAEEIPEWLLTQKYCEPYDNNTPIPLYEWLRHRPLTPIP